MAANDPYSRDEIDLKLENMFQRFQLDANRRDQQMLDHFKKIDTSFRLLESLLEKDITWLSRVTMGLALLMLGILVTGALKWSFHSNGMTTLEAV